MQVSYEKRKISLVQLEIQKLYRKISYRHGPFLKANILRVRVLCSPHDAYQNPFQVLFVIQMFKLL
jgi:hypothetical protein